MSYFTDTDSTIEDLCNSIDLRFNRMNTILDRNHNELMTTMEAMHGELFRARAARSNTLRMATDVYLAKYGNEALLNTGQYVNESFGMVRPLYMAIVADTVELELAREDEYRTSDHGVTGRFGGEGARSATAGDVRREGNRTDHCHAEEMAERFGGDGRSMASVDMVSTARINHMIAQNRDDRVAEMVERFSEDRVSTARVDGETETDRERKREREDGSNDRKAARKRRGVGQV
jgi:hypothetical protein